MKKLLIGLLVLGSFSTFADYGEEQLTLTEKDITQKVERAEERINFIQKVKKARRDYRAWKESEPNHKEQIRSLRKLTRAMKKKGTLENTALREVLKKCKADKVNCESKLESVLNSIALSNNLVFHKKESFSLFNSAHASVSDTMSCNDGQDGEMTTYHLLLMGSYKRCGISYLGPGLLITHSLNVMMCTNSYARGVNVGFGVNAAAMFGAGVSMVFGSNGACTMLNLNFGLGASAGVVMVDTAMGDWY